jgi:S-adenosylmethionine decarboxylase
VLDDVCAVERALRAAATAAGSTIVGAAFHRFEPHGASGVLLIAESHLSVHTWPEYRFAAADLFTCSPRLDADAALMVLRSMLGASRIEAREVERGRLLAATK